MTLQIQKIVLALTLAHKVFVVIVIIGHFLMNVFSTQMLPPIGNCMQLPSAYRLYERQKQRSYDQRVREIEHGSFTPLVFSTSGGMHGEMCFRNIQETCLSSIYQARATLRATIAWIRCCLSFSLLRSSIMCLRGARSSQGRAFRISAIDLAVAEAKVPSVSV